MKKIAVVKIGGRVLGDKNSFGLFLKSIKSLKGKYYPVIVHGGGSEISSWLDRTGIKYHFVDGQRYTTPDAAVVVEMVLSGKVNKFLSSALNTAKIPAAGISLRDGHTAVSRKVPKLGCVGLPYKINSALILCLVKSGFVPVVSTISEDASGVVLNVNADAVCPMLAKALNADKLIYLTDVDGVLDNDSRTIKIIRLKGLDNLIKSGVITGGMIPKIKSAAMAVKNGVKEIEILNGNKGVKPGSGTKIIK